MAGASPIPLVTVVVPVVSVSVLGVVVVVILPLEERGNPITWSQSFQGQRSGIPTLALPLAPEDTYIPVVLSVIVSVSVVLVVAAVEPFVVSPVSVIEITVALRKEGAKR